ncbi:hypothetical protein MNBD_NITROSPINAE01-792 [hydrothermal vent metagenome]|uniref:Peptidase M43 pregnancy-associated plasma-A domain-containing protein n=1 Tax=hydrothermal vent metagenome TaxID=652676 RepID=A0A3B1BYE0_9ZZZZ
MRTSKKYVLLCYVKDWKMTKYPPSSILRSSLLFTTLFIIFTLSGCSGGGGGGADDNESTALIITPLNPAHVPAGEFAWVSFSGAEPDLTAFTAEGGVVNQIIFNSEQTITVDGIKSGDTLFYDYDRNSGSKSSSAGLPIDFMSYQYGLVALPDKTISAILPPIHTVSTAFPAGSYQFKIQNLGLSDATVNVTQVYKTDGDFSSGKLDINLFVYTAGEPNPVIPDRKEANNIKNLLNDVLGQAGITINNLRVEFIDNPEVIADMNTGDDLTQFLASASRETLGRSDNGINCFLLPWLPNRILGRDGAIPGPAIHGTQASGIVARAAKYGYSAEGFTEHETDQRVLVKILAHEIGHYMGLFHTTESDGNLKDPLPDTPECGIENDQNGDGKVTGPECRDKGAANLMFWTIDSGLISTGSFQSEISGYQLDVVNTHPLVR